MRALIVICLAGLPIPQDSTQEIDQAIRSLSDSSLEAREKAEALLVKLGPKALPAVRKALEADDIETRHRAKRILAELERPELEKKHDEANRKKIFKPADASDDLSAVIKDLYPLTIEGARYYNKAKVFEGGLVISTRFFEEASVALEFDIRSVTTKDGKPLQIERCGRCSPEMVYVRDAGPIRAKVSGIRKWHSEYDVEFNDPKDGHQKRIGDFVITIKWPELEIACPRGYPVDIQNRICRFFDYRLKEPAHFDTMGIGGGGGGGGRYGGRFGGKKKWWCSCADGPKPVEKKDEVKAPSLWRVIYQVIGSGIDPLDRIAAVTLKFSKPIEEPFEADPPEITASDSSEKPAK